MTTGSPTTAERGGADAAVPLPTKTVLIADEFEPAGIEELESLSCRVRLDAELCPETLPAAIAEHDPDILVVGSTRVGAPALDAAGRLSLIVRAGDGHDTIDVDLASAKGIFVTSCPGKSPIAVAELAWALILACDRRLPDQCADLRGGRWNRKEYARKAHGLHGRTLGVVGLGRVGCEVARRGKAFGMKVIGWSHGLTEERADELGVGFCSNLINLVKLADVISIHVAATADTEGLVGEKFCSALRPGACVVNTSHGSVVDEAALIKAIRGKGVRAGLDVFATEPEGSVGEFADRIIREPGVYGTHRVGASTEQAEQSIAAEVVHTIETYRKTGSVPNCVNRATSQHAANVLTVRHLNRPGVLAHIFRTLGQAGINVEEMENIMYEGAKAACARIQLNEPPDEKDLEAIRANDDVLSVDLTMMSQ
jgi:D-3-phosphoglycerate dehydrogenase